jgi:hypothetical protein
MERVEVEGQVATAHTMAMLFSAIPPSRGGPVDIFIVDIHALQERFYFDPRSSVVNPISAIAIFIARLMAKCVSPDALCHASIIYFKLFFCCRYPPREGGTQMKFAFPDEGAFKRFGKPLQAHCPSLYRDGNVVICGKVASDSIVVLVHLCARLSSHRLMSFRRPALATIGAFG